MDFYKQRRFICEITGHSGLNFFEALKSEVCCAADYPIIRRWSTDYRQTDESREVNSAFPEALKEPILRKIQFSIVSRIDNLGEFRVLSWTTRR